MNKFLIKSLSTTKFILFSVIAFVLTFTFVYLTYNYIGKKIYPAITLILSAVLSICLIKRSYWVIFEIKIQDLQMSINNKVFFINNLKGYAFNETEHFFGCKLIFENYNLILNVAKKNPGDYLKFKNDVITKIKRINYNEEYKIHKYNWYSSNSAKIYSYFMIIIMLIWFFMMLYFPKKFKWSNFGLFLLVLSGLIPILLRIFNKNKKI